MRLPRPYIPLEVRCRVALRQLGEMWPDEVIASAPRFGGLLMLLEVKKAQLAYLLGIKTALDLHLDHDPALGAREKIRKHGKIVGYRPDANDSDHLAYRTKESHRIKTLIRGDGAQYSDRALIKRERRRMRGPRPKRKWPSRPFPKGKRQISSRLFGKHR